MRRPALATVWHRGRPLPGHGINNSWIGPATRFTSGYGHVSMDLPDSKHLRIDRTDFVPDGRAPW